MPLLSSFAFRNEPVLSVTYNAVSRQCSKCAFKPTALGLRPLSVDRTSDLSNPAVKQHPLCAPAAPMVHNSLFGVAVKSSLSCQHCAHPQKANGSHDNAGVKHQTANASQPHEEEAVFKPCLQLVQQGRTTDALTQLLQIISDGSFPERATADAILLGIASPAGAGRVDAALTCLQLLPSAKGHHYYQLIKYYGDKRNLSALSQLQQALSKDFRWKTFKQKPIAPWFALVQSYGQLHKPDLAARAFDECWRLGHWTCADVKTANALLNALHADLNATYNRYELLLSAGFKPDRVTFNTLLKACMRSKNVQMATWTYQQMLQQSVPADEYTYTTLIKTFSYSGQTDEALNVQQDMVAAGFDVTDTVWGSLITACGQAGQLQSALRLWEGFKEARQGLYNISNPEPCQALLIACAETYQMAPALAVLAEIKQAGIPMNAIMYNCAMNACRVPPSRTMPVESLDRAFELLEEMKLQGVPADNSTYGTLMNLCAEAKKGHRAYQLMQKLEGDKVKLDKVVYTAYMKACASSPDLLEPAHAAFKRMIWGPRRMKPSQVTFITMMRLFREQGRPHQALDVYLGMRRAGFPGVNAEFQELVQACAEAALDNNDSELQLKVKTHLLDHQKEGQLETVDLHSLSAKEARAAVLCVLANIQERFKHGKSIPAELAIIVGQGQHVQEEGPKLRDAVEQLLHQQLHMPVKQLEQAATQQAVQGHAGDTKEPHGEQILQSPQDQQREKRSKKVNARQDRKENKGRVVVTKDALLQWLQSKPFKDVHQQHRSEAV